ncbi:MAG: peptide chain release factor 2 [Eubacteriales bacterium]|nr:peptide chain release factor 2 [Eubacteriales bacterium]
MVELDNLKINLQKYEAILQEINASLNLDQKKERLIELDRAMEEPTFWTNIEKANMLSKESSNIKNDINTFKNLSQEYEDIFTMIEIANEENDASLISEIKNMVQVLSKKIEDMRTKLLLSGEFDSLNAIIKLNAGAGGTESCDWCSMLYRMYNRFAESKGYTFKVLDYLEGDEAGIKSVTFEICGEYAYGYFRSENGIHRLVRISPFNAQGKRQTSFVSCEVMPDIEEDLDIEIKDEDLKMDVYRSSGAGGQHINKTSSAVRLTHIPTGIVVACQEERSQFQNRDKAMQMLKAKLFIMKKQENDKMLLGIRGEQKENGWGSQIRSYVLQPYRMVKDLRTGEETSNTESVLDGNIGKFISSYLKWIQLGSPDRKVQAGN